MKKKRVVKKGKKNISAVKTKRKIAKKIKKRMPASKVKKNISPKNIEKKDVNAGYTREIQKEMSQIKKIEGKKINADKEYEKKRQKYREEKKDLLKTLRKLKEKKTLEKENLTKLISYVEKK